MLRKEKITAVAFLVFCIRSVHTSIIVEFSIIKTICNIQTFHGHFFIGIPEKQQKDKYPLLFLSDNKCNNCPSRIAYAILCYCSVPQMDGVMNRKTQRATEYRFSSFPQSVGGNPGCLNMDPRQKNSGMTTY